MHRQQTAAALTALATATFLMLQMRHSRTARACVQSVVHLAFTTGAGTALAGSLVALVAPYLYQQAVRQQTNTNNDGDAREQQQQQQQETPWNWSAVTSSLAAAVMACISIPRNPTNPARPGLANRVLQWKGTVLALVLAYFQYRRRQRLTREAQQTATYH
jgi:hypothetical protein